MPRVPYVPIDLAEPKEIVDAVRKRRGGTLSHLDRILLHSPALAQGWNTYLGAVRQHLGVSPKRREIVMCCVAVLNKAEYEFFHHAPEFLNAGGTQAQVNALRDPDAASKDSALFDAAERAIIQLTIEMTRDVAVSAGTYQRFAQEVGDSRQVVELVATCAAYNMVSRMIVALHIKPEA